MKIVLEAEIFTTANRVRPFLLLVKYCQLPFDIRLKNWGGNRNT